MDATAKESSQLAGARTETPKDYAPQIVTKRIKMVKINKLMLFIFN